MTQEEALEKYIELLRKFRIGDEVWYYNGKVDKYFEHPEKLESHIMSMTIEEFILWKEHTMLKQKKGEYILLAFGSWHNLAPYESVYIEHLYTNKEAAIAGSGKQHKQYLKERKRRDDERDARWEAEAKAKEDEILRKAAEIKKKRK